MRAGDITVAIAACGRVGSLERCVAGLVAGTASPGELIVVDQAPSDQARRAVMGHGLPRARYLEQALLGVSASRNLALEQCAGRVLALIDDDCVPDPDWLAALAGSFDTGIAAVTGSILSLGDRPPGAHAISLRTSTARADHRGKILPWIPGSGGNFAARRGLLCRLGGWDPRLGPGTPGQAAEDADLIYRILRSGATVRYEPAAVVRHEWQSWDRRLATRASYGYGVGALCGMWLGRGDPFAGRMLAAYARFHLHELAVAARRRQPEPFAEHGRALQRVIPGVVYGLRARRPRPTI